MPFAAHPLLACFRGLASAPDPKLVPDFAPAPAQHKVAATPGAHGLQSPGPTLQTLLLTGLLHRSAWCGPFVAAAHRTNAADQGPRQGRTQQAQAQPQAQEDPGGRRKAQQPSLAVRRSPMLSARRFAARGRQNSVGGKPGEKRRTVEGCIRPGSAVLSRGRLGPAVGGGRLRAEPGDSHTFQPRAPLRLRHWPPRCCCSRRHRCCCGCCCRERSAAAAHAATTFSPP